MSNSDILRYRLHQGEKFPPPSCSSFAHDVGSVRVHAIDARSGVVNRPKIRKKMTRISPLGRDGGPVEHWLCSSGVQPSWLDASASPDSARSSCSHATHWHFTPCLQVTACKAVPISVWRYHMQRREALGGALSLLSTQTERRAYDSYERTLWGPRPPWHGSASKGKQTRGTHTTNRFDILNTYENTAENRRTQYQYILNSHLR